MIVALRIFLVLPILLATTQVGAAECSSNQVQQLRKDCQAIIHDIKGTRKLGRQEEDKGFEAGKGGAIKGTSCLVNTGKLITSCYAGSPSCTKEIVKIPSTVKKCVEAIELINAAIAHYKRASAYYGAASVAFDDQGGESILNQLAECGTPGCQEYPGLVDLLRQDKERVQRNIERLNKYKSRLEEAKSKLEACKTKGRDCDQDAPNDTKMETLEPPTDDVQQTPVPLG